MKEYVFEVISVPGPCTQYTLEIPIWADSPDSALEKVYYKLKRIWMNRGRSDWKIRLLFTR